LGFFKFNFFEGAPVFDEGVAGVPLSWHNGTVWSVQVWLSPDRDVTIIWFVLV